ncbi:hypothetical protein EKO23_17980 [Nocardioides guangzhouensis]|uniref:Secreted protein n=1 Tax=Nocardioides guangzhouensis TaxID=2497878 RepID=A0A4Q4Z7P5_9ACTN|nr:DUF6049 family protein [Nocardioides guangzhouensis]RYP83792.1 hypothetical protein EKO23_17980 [Nocardioides guangzhouensis]
MIRPVAALCAPLVAAVAAVTLGPGPGTGDGVLDPSTAGADTPAVVSAAPSGDDLTARRSVPVSRNAQRRAASQDLDVTLDGLNPSVIPQRGAITMRGTITNTTEETLTSINVHPLTSYSPMTTAREIEVSVESDPEIYIGQRITDIGRFDNVEDLAPGQSVSWSVRVPADELLISGEEGVYWIGVQVLAADTDGFRSIHGRARSFIPLMRGKQEQVPTSLILPVRRAIERAADGRVRRADEWANELSPGGRLANLTSFVRSSGTAPVTWLIDPAVVDAVDQLARGNPRRNLEPTEPAPGEENTDQQDEEQAAAEEEQRRNGLPEAQQWLSDVRSLTSRNPVLALPYGDLDVAAASRYSPVLYDRARALSSEVLGALDIESNPAMAPPSGLLNPGALELAPQDTQIFLSEEAIGEEYDDPADVPSTIESAGRRIAITDHTVGVGGPGPDERLSGVALRQRVLAEAAVRSLAGDTSALTVDLPFDFDPGSRGQQFFRGLEQPFLQMVPASVDRTGPAPEVSRVAYPTRQVVRELNEANLASTDRFIDTGERLDSILVRNDTVGDQVLREALCTSSYMVRDDPVSAQVAADDASTLLRNQLERIRIEAPSFVILSSDSGPFAVTVTNDLDQPVRVRIEAQTSDDVVIKAPEEITLEAETRQTVQLSAEAASLGVHPVRLVATNVDGQPIGAFDELDIRSNTVGVVIWVIMGVGVGILAISIPVRWARRRRRGSTTA